MVPNRATHHIYERQLSSKFMKYYTLALTNIIFVLLLLLLLILLSKFYIYFSCFALSLYFKDHNKNKGIRLFFVILAILIFNVINIVININISYQFSCFSFLYLIGYLISYKLKLTLLRKKCPYSELCWSLFSRIRNEYGEMRSIYPHSVRMWENKDQKNSKYRHFSCSVNLHIVRLGLSYYYYFQKQLPRGVL